MISLDGLTRRFGSTRALDGVTLSVPQGEIFGFVGPNGAGKTTTMRILATLLAPTSGTASVDGIDVVRHPDAVRQRLGYMPDFFGVYDRLTVAEYLDFYAACYRVPRQRRQKIVSDLLELVNLSDRRDDAVNALSRGMKQRLCLARALVHDPKVLVLDEPASGLDPRARVEMREVLKELRTMGKTILISSHILPELTELCTMVGIIDRGRMRASGPVRGVVDSLTAGRRLRIEVLGRHDDALAALRALSGVQATAGADDAIEVRYEGDDTRSAQILQDLIAAGISVASFARVEAGLEDAFLHATSDEAA